MTPLLAFAVIGLVLLFVTVLLAVAYDVENSPKVKKTILRGGIVTLLVDARGQEASIAEWLNKLKKEHLSHIDCVFIVSRIGGLQGVAKGTGVTWYRPRKGDEQEVMRRAYRQSQRGAIVITLPVSVYPSRLFLARVAQTVKQEQGRAVYYGTTTIPSEMSLTSFTGQVSETLIAELKCIASMFKSPVIVRRSWQAAYRAEDFLSGQPLVYYYDARVCASCSSLATKLHSVRFFMAGFIVTTTLLLAENGIALPLILAWATCTIAAFIAFLFSLQERNWWSLMAIPAFYFLMVPAALIKKSASSR